MDAIARLCDSSEAKPKSVQGAAHGSFAPAPATALAVAGYRLARHRPPRTPTMLPIASMVTVRPSSRIHCTSRSRPARSSSLSASRQLPPPGSAPMRLKVSSPEQAVAVDARSHAGVHAR
jgi:hypothetical protein